MNSRSWTLNRFDKLRQQPLQSLQPSRLGWNSTHFLLQHLHLCRRWCDFEVLWFYSILLSGFLQAMTWILASRKALQARYGSDAAIQAQPYMPSHKFGGFHSTLPKPQNRPLGGHGDRDPDGSSWEASQGDPPACFNIFSLQSAKALIIKDPRHLHKDNQGTTRHQ